MTLAESKDDESTVTGNALSLADKCVEFFGALGAGGFGAGDNYGLEPSARRRSPRAGQFGANIDFLRAVWRRFGAARRPDARVCQ